MKKFLLFLILLIPIFNIKAFTFCDNTELPDIPQDINYTNYVIIEYVPGSIYRLITFTSNANVYINNEIIYFNDINFVRFYTLNNDSWGIPQVSQSRNYSLADSVGNIVFATTIDILEGDNILYSANYNIECFTPLPDIPQDFSLINTIAGYVNDFVTGLQNNNISIHIIFVGLLIFNFLVFVICYFITHLE